MDADDLDRQLGEGFDRFWANGDFGVPIFARRTRLWLIEAELARLIDDVQRNRNRPEENA